MKSCINKKIYSVNWYYLVHNSQNKVVESWVPHLLGRNQLLYTSKSSHFNHIHYFFKHSYFTNTVAIIVNTQYWSSDHMFQKEKCIIIRDQISRAASIACIQPKLLRLCTCLRINFTLHNSDIFRICLHETRSELKLV